MDRFDCVFDALRKVKRLSREIEDYDEIYFAYNEYYECYFVTIDRDELSEEIYKLWCDGGCDCKPEYEADRYKIWEYSLAKNKEKYPNTYRSARKSLIRSGVPLIRRSNNIYCDYSVSFEIQTLI
ncbi:hypothetical protein MOD25_05975 [Bacillus haynesii]|uniref:hypothetical protein n=1 Tax=Bacillus haynesii TaxID=1925021 RepID=UPI0022808D3F|nr:hypothetical protein [Bacillus haynesii]MCY8549451.1 hypothetical protein [Bacillus haynesii]